MTKPRSIRRCGERVPRLGSAASSGVGMRLRARPSRACGASGSRPKRRWRPRVPSPAAPQSELKKLRTGVLGDGVKGQAKPQESGAN